MSWTAAQLTAELDVAPQRIAQLAKGWGWERVGRTWSFSDEQADRLREHVRTWDARASADPVPCSVGGCKERATARGMCHAHYLRVYRHGSTEVRDGAEHQRAKTHCPHGHPYDEVNTYVFADGRRRCRACRLEHSRRKPTA